MSDALALSVEYFDAASSNVTSPSLIFLRTDSAFFLLLVLPLSSSANRMWLLLRAPLYLSAFLFS